MAGHGMRLSKFANPTRSTPFGDVLSAIEVVEHDATDTRWMNGINMFVPATTYPIRHSLDCDFDGTDLSTVENASYTREFEPFLIQSEVSCSTLSTAPALEELRTFVEAEFPIATSLIAEAQMFTGAFNKNGLVDNNEGFQAVATDVSASGGTPTADLISYAEYLAGSYFNGAQAAIFIPADEFAHVTHAAGLPFIDGRWYTPTGNQLIPFTTGLGEAGGPAEQVWIAETPIVLHLGQMNTFVPETWIEFQKNKFHVHVERVGLFEYRNVLSFDIA